MPHSKKIAITTGGNIPIDQLLGYLVILVHHRFEMDIETVEKIMSAAELSEKYWPHHPKKHHVFNKACRLLQTRSGDQEKFIDPSNGMELWFDVEYFIDILPGGARQLSRKIQYTSGSKDDISEDTKKMLDIYVEKTQKEPEKMAIFEFNEYKEKKEETDGEEKKEEPTEEKTEPLTEDEIVQQEISITPIYSDKNPLNIKEMTEKQHKKLLTIYKRLKKSYTERYLKMAWEDMMYDLKAIPYCGSAGNIWFVPKAGRSAIDAFGKAYKTIHNEEGNTYTWRMIPVIDTEAQRKYIKKDAEREIMKRYEDYLERLGKRVEKVKTQEDLDKLRDKTAEKNQKFEQEMNERLIDRYSKILKTSIDIKLRDVDENKQTHLTSRMRRAIKFLETGK